MEKDSLENLRNGLQEWKTATAKNARRRELWRKQVKPTVSETLNAISQHYADFKFKVVVDEEDGSDSVYLEFPSEPLGIKVNKDKELEKKGGALLFGVNYHGFIAVAMEYPLIAVEEEETEIKILANDLEPTTFGGREVLNYFAQFLSEMSGWETGSTRKKIGFDVPRRGL